MTVAAFVLVAVAVVVLSLSECCLVCGLWEVSVHVFVCEYGHVCVREMDGYCCMWVSVGVSLQAPRYTRTRNPGLHYTTHNTFAGSCRCCSCCCSCCRCRYCCNCCHCQCCCCCCCSPLLSLSLLLLLLFNVRVRQRTGIHTTTDRTHTHIHTRTHRNTHTY